MSMSCLRIKSSKRSSGPSYTSPTVTEKGKSLSSFFFPECGVTSTGCAPFKPEFWATTFECSAIGSYSIPCQRHAHRLADLAHGGGGNPASLRRSRLQNIPGQPGILLIFLAALLHGAQDLHQRICRPAFALDAPDARRTAALVYLRHSFLAAEDLVQVPDRALIGIAFIGAPDACWIGHHRLQLLTDYRLGIGKQDGVAVRFRHLAAIGPGELRRRC